LDDLGGKLNKKNYKYVFFILLIILGRIVFLDADLPTSFALTDLYTFDEGFYTQSAFNLYNYRTLTHNVVPYITGDAGIANLFQTILTYISLLIFGNNYYGVRMPSVFISLITIWLFYLTLRNIKGDNSKFTNYSVFFMVLYFVTDFEYLSISRIYVPTVFRIFFITLMIYIFSRYYKKTYKEIFTYKNIFFFSFLSMSSIFFIYIYNIFIYSATVFTIFIVSIMNNWKDNKKQIVKDSGFIILGSLFALLLFIIYLKFNYDISLWEYIKTIINSEQSTRLLKLNKLDIINHIISILFQFFSTSIFRFNTSLLLLFLLTVPIFIILVFKRKNVFYILLANLLLFQLFQLFFENSYYRRRLTIILPIILLIILFVINFLKTNLKYFFKKQKFKKIFIISIWMIISVTISMLIFYKINIVGGDKVGALNALGNELFNGNLNINFIIISSIVYILILILIIFLIFKTKIKMLIIILIFLLIPNFLLIFTYTYSYQQNYHSKNTMINLSKNINYEIIPGQSSFSFRFYNHSKPVLNWYRYYSTRRKEYVHKFSKILLSKKSKYFLQFYHDINPPFQFINKKESPILFVPKEVFYIGNGFLLVFYKVRYKNEKTY